MKESLPELASQLGLPEELAREREERKKEEKDRPSPKVLRLLERSGLHLLHPVSKR